VERKDDKLGVTSARPKKRQISRRHLTDVTIPADSLLLFLFGAASYRRENKLAASRRRSFSVTADREVCGRRTKWSVPLSIYRSPGLDRNSKHLSKLLCQRPDTQKAPRHATFLKKNKNYGEAFRSSARCKCPQRWVQSLNLPNFQVPDASTSTMRSEEDFLTGDSELKNEKVSTCLTWKMVSTCWRAVRSSTAGAVNLPSMS
jgi:hypothetical protein